MRTSPVGPRRVWRVSLCRGTGSDKRRVCPSVCRSIGVGRSDADHATGTGGCNVRPSYPSAMASTLTILRSSPRPRGWRMGALGDAPPAACLLVDVFKRPWCHGAYHGTHLLRRARPSPAAAPGCVTSRRLPACAGVPPTIRRSAFAATDPGARRGRCVVVSFASLPMRPRRPQGVSPSSTQPIPNDYVRITLN